MRASVTEKFEHGGDAVPYFQTLLLLPQGGDPSLRILNLQARVRFPVAPPTFLKLFIPKRIRFPFGAWDCFSRIFKALRPCVLGWVEQVVWQTRGSDTYERVKVQEKWN
jgi:hypothetical protein